MPCRLPPLPRLKLPSLRASPCNGLQNPYVLGRSSASSARRSLKTDFGNPPILPSPTTR
jgi:hypothetical protein